MSQASSPRGNRAAPSGSTATRGVIVVVAALIVGILLIAKGGGGEAVADRNSEIEGTTTTVAGTTQTTQPNTTKGTAVAPAQLPIIAANGSTVKGLAGKTKTQLAAAGYTSVIATDASAKVSTSIVYFAPGFQKDAEAVAAVIGMPPARVGQMPDPAQIPVKSVGDVKVVIVLGPDAPNATGGTTATTAAP